MNPVFLDTSALFSTGHPGSTHHAVCRDAYRRLLEDRKALVTTEFVVAEVHALATARVGPHRAMRLLEGVTRAGRIDIVPVDAALRGAAIEFLRSRPGRPYSLADAVSFVVMRDRGATWAFTLDADFRAEGFSLIPAIE